jgi:hypothetical protein
MRFRPLLGLCALLALVCGQAFADAPLRLTANDVIDLQSQQEKVGDHWRYLSTTDATYTGSHAGRQTNRLVFDIEVIGLSSEAITLRYTLREAEVTDARQPGIVAATKAFIGIPIEFEARQGYEPYRLTDWPAVKAAYYKALDRLAPGDTALKAAVEAGFGRLEAGDPEGLAGNMVGDMPVLAGMQQVAAPRQRVDIPAQTQDLGEGRTLVMTGWMGLDSVDEAKCQATWTRDTHRVGSGGQLALDYELKTTATLSTRDGWVMTLSETTQQRYGEDTEAKTVTLTRQGAAPGCG